MSITETIIPLKAKLTALKNLYLVLLDLEGRKDEIESLIREVHDRLGRRPILISTEIKELIREVLVCADLEELEKEWYKF
ncbi:MAG: hypothetical protein NDP16_06015 [Crenarchaeota archaeon]|nr:hypothetical protein [Thermoproteota archaeon]MCR8471409.1 hypothetical protein [Thermoproteota archaeon]